MFALLLVLLLVPACTRIGMRVSASRVYTLYSNSAFTDERVHIATFDASQRDPSYNAVNCEQVRALEEEAAEGRPVELKFWCEKGYYRE
jgi:hypothetical protein